MQQKEFTQLEKKMVIENGWMDDGWMKYVY